MAAKTKLTPKQKLFVKEYLKDLNATAAAKRAGYSLKTAGVIGLENLGKPLISKAIKAAIKRRNDKVEIDADWVLMRLRDELVADVNDLINPDGKVKEVKDWPMVWRQGLVTGIKSDEAGIADLKISDRVKRLELAGRHVSVQAFKDQLAVEDNTGLAEMLRVKREARRNGDS